MKKYFVILVILALAIFISGCIGLLTTPGDDLIAPGRGRLEIYLTDSSEKYKVNDAETYSAVNITISKIQVHLAGENEEAEGEWIWVLGEESNNNLIIIEELTDNFILLSEVELTPGKYTQIRLFVTDASVYIELGEIGVPVEIPSNLQTGLKLIHPFKIIENGTTELTIDFDADKSVVKTDNEEYILKPVIKVTSSTTINDSTPVNGNGL